MSSACSTRSTAARACARSSASCGWDHSTSRRSSSASVAPASSAGASVRRLYREPSKGFPNPPAKRSSRRSRLALTRALTRYRGLAVEGGVGALELVAHAAHRLQPLAQLAQLGAQVEHVRVDGAHASDVAIAPDARKKLLAGKHAPHAISEKPEKLKLVGREAERLPPLVGLTHLAVERDVAVTDLQRRARPFVARLELAQPRRQLIGADRNQDEVVGPHLRIEP